MKVGLTIPFDVAGEFESPPGGVPGWRGLVLRAPVPEAPVHEHREARPREDDVGASTAHAWKGSIDAVAQAPSMELAPEPHLWLGVTPPLTCHPAGDNSIDGESGVRRVGHGVPSGGQLVSSAVYSLLPSSDSEADLARPRDHDPAITTLDLFAGAGGLSEGLSTASVSRFKTVRAVEWDLAAAATYTLNHGGSLREGTIEGGPVYAGAIEDWLADDDVPEVDVVVGGPPCQGFSTLNRAGVGAHRNELWRLYGQTVQRARPHYFVLENVPAFLKSEQWGVFQEELAGGILRDYAIEAWVLNAADYGAVQARKRVIVIGHHKDLAAPGRPEPTHLGGHRHLDEALLGVPRAVDRIGIPEGTIEYLGKEMPGFFSTRQLHFGRSYTQLSLDRFSSISHNGGSRSELPDELKAPCWLKHSKGSGDVMGRLTWEKPSVTIRTEFFKPEKGRYIHPDQDRVITHYEAALIQGFRHDYRWVGTREELARQIGNAVPIPLGAAIGRLLTDAFDGAAQAVPAVSS